MSTITINLVNNNLILQLANITAIDIKQAPTPHSVDFRGVTIACPLIKYRVRVNYNILLFCFEYLII